MTERQLEKAIPAESSADEGAQSETSGFRGLLQEMQRDSYRLLAWVAAVLAFVGVCVSLVWVLFPAGVQAQVGIDIRARMILIVLGVTVALVCRLRSLPASWFPGLALLFEVAVGAVLATEFLYWPGLAEGSGFLLGVPRVALWVVFFANVVPLRPQEHLFGAAAASSLTILWFWIGGRAAAASLAEPGAEAMWHHGMQLLPGLVVGAAVATGLAFVSARRLYGLSRELTRARRVGAYDLTEKLGRGGMGEVWRARHRMLARPAAIKLIRSDRTTGSNASDAEYYLERFQREVQATASLRSPHTIQVYDYGITPDRSFYYVMELLDGVDLDGLVKSHGPLPVGRVIHIVRQVCGSLAEAHDSGLIHRDIKPANIFLCRLGREVDHVKVLDFGLVKEISRPQDSHLTQVGTFAGTPAFGSPEAAAGRVDQIGPASDIYSVGCVAYWLLTGETVFAASGAMEMLASHIREVPAPPSDRMELPLPEEIDRVVLACLEKDPRKRTSSADELDEALAELQPRFPWSARDARGWWVLHRPERSA